MQLIEKQLHWRAIALFQQQRITLGTTSKITVLHQDRVYSRCQTVT
ncbi:MAG: hypothetical protein F6K47_03435 [Symploca sp. SIO2E6]|nr:hypothetical protein [Symploca sp. SIO2E6]